MSALVVAARRTLQPGSPRADRVTVAVSPRPRRALVWLPEGQTLYSSLVSAFEALIARQFGSLIWAPGRSADWDAFAADFFPEASLYPAARPATRQTVAAFIERMKGWAGTKLRSFREVVLGTEVRMFGYVAVALAACEMTENDGQVNRPGRRDVAPHQE
jgi:hypothetical protein